MRTVLAMDPSLPTCGLYRTTVAIREVPAGRLVYFHNHGDPGAGVYLPSSWRHNRAIFQTRGTTLPAHELAATLRPLPRQGLQRVVRAFTCCERRCRTWTAESLVQLGYNGEGRAIVFSPTLTDSGLTIPTSGTIIDDERLADLAPLEVAEAFTAPDPVVH